MLEMPQAAIHTYIEQTTSSDENIDAYNNPLQSDLRKSFSTASSQSSENLHNYPKSDADQQISYNIQHPIKDGLSSIADTSRAERSDARKEKLMHSSLNGVVELPVTKVDGQETRRVNYLASNEISRERSQQNVENIEGDEHFLDDFDTSRKEEVLKLFWTDLWPKLEGKGWSLRNEVGPDETVLLFISADVHNEQRGDRIYRTISEIVSDNDLRSIRELKDVLRGFDGLKSVEHKTLDWKNKRSCYPKKSSLVGPLHQVSSLPNLHQKRSRKGEESSAYEQCWDHARAERTDGLFEYLETVSGERKEFALNALHENEYRVEGAEALIDQYIQKCRRRWTAKEKKNFATSMWQHRKNMRFAVQSTGRSYNDCLHYYLNEYKKSSDYKNLKKIQVAEREKLKAESELHDETCNICDDGGSLILCEKCDAGYHLKCLSPPLEEVPSGVWYCPVCSDDMLSSLKRKLLPNTYAVPKKKISNNRIHEPSDGNSIEDGSENHDDVKSIQSITTSFANEIFEVLTSDFDIQL